jgi:hypothetical protein
MTRRDPTRGPTITAEVKAAGVVGAPLTKLFELRLFTPPAAAAKDHRPQPNWAAIHREPRRPGVMLQLLREETRAVQPDGYGN